jgi:hypothetical protein
MLSMDSWSKFVFDPAFGGIATAIGVFVALLGILYSARVTWRGAKVQTLLKVTEWLETTREDRDRIRYAKEKCPEGMNEADWQKLMHDWTLDSSPQNFEWLGKKSKDDKIRIIAVNMVEHHLTPEQKASIARVCRSFDVLGFMDRHRLIDEMLVDELYGTSLQSMHAPIFDAFVCQQRSEEPTRFWELVQLDQRIDRIREIHPAKDDAPAWRHKRRRRVGLRGRTRRLIEGTQDAVDRGFRFVDGLLG